MVTGNQVTDLLKQVPYSPEDRDFQPKHILYLPVRTIGMDIVEVQVAENDVCTWCDVHHATFQA